MQRKKNIASKIQYLTNKKFLTNIQNFIIAHRGKYV